ncbi:MAG: RNA-protein complex protein Nop10 [Thermoplasmataceae archaeon]
MHSLIRKCRICNTYTMKEVCPVCGQRTDVALPPKYSPVDRFQRFRINSGEEHKNGENNNQSV